MAFNSISSSQVFLAIMILASSAKAQGPDSPFCRGTNVGEERTLCTSLVNGAPTWEAALTNVIKAFLDEGKLAKPFVDGIHAKLPTTLLPVTKESIEKTCAESFEGFLDDLNGALDNIKIGDPTKSIDSELSAAVDRLGDCTDGLGEFGQGEPEINKLDTIVQKYLSISLAVSSANPSKKN